MADIDIRVIGNVPGEHAIAWYSIMTGYPHVRVSNLQHMINMIMVRIGSADRIRTLTILDHGYAYRKDFESEKYLVGHGHFMIGNTRVTSLESGARDTVHISVFARIVAPLRAHLAPGARIVLEGCRLGTADQLLIGVSAAFGGIPVIAGTGNQRSYVPGIEGDVRRCVQLSDRSECSTQDIATPLDDLVYMVDEALSGGEPSPF